MRLAGSSRTLFLAGAIALSAGCARHVRTDASPARNEATLHVANQSYLDIVVYTLFNGQRVRLGLVPAASRRTLTIPANVVGQGRRLQFLGDPVGSSREPISEELYVQPGDEVDMIIPSEVR